MRALSLAAAVAVVTLLAGCSTVQQTSFLSSSGPQYGKGHEMRMKTDPAGWHRDGGNIYEPSRLGAKYQASNGRICADYVEPIHIRGQRHTASGTVCQDGNGDWKPIWTQF